MKVLHYQFSHPALLDIALTHRSVSGNNNERMEFLGDAILNFVIAEALFTQFSKAPEGYLSRLRSNLVNENVLAEIANEFHLGEHLRLGAGELKSGGMRRKSILADALEAIIGAIYLDADMVTCQKVVLHWFDERLKQVEVKDAIKDAKSLLQEYLQSRKLALPNYTIVEVLGEAHAQHFHVTCEVQGIEHRTEGVGTSRRIAEQMAAETFLQWLKQHPSIA